jgi:hypothetical protein
MSCSTRALTVLLIGAAALASVATAADGTGGGFGGGGAGGSGGNGAINVWVVGASPGRSAGGGQGIVCTWTQVTSGLFPSPAAPIPVSRLIAGARYLLYVRECGHGPIVAYWIPDLSARQLAQAARDLVTRKLPPLAPELSPPVATGGFVNFPTWFAAADPGPISVAASIPGLSAVVTARVRNSQWDAGDGSIVHCSGLGTPRSAGSAAVGACSHTFAASSAREPGDAFTITVSVTWTVTWRASTGQTGTLPDITTTTSFAYRVREVQTIGVAG